ncbi:GNAT family N-acetyltransferase [Allosphingosinicella sp.]|uniref:GNAT family N-acetyltransferase n=1 Tax=Allosphingosinicella sp. TaxID=2823234 RepID=UPI003D753C0D
MGGRALTSSGETLFATTERLILRKPRPEDLEPLIVSWSDPEMTRFTGLRTDVRSFVAQMIADAQAKDPGAPDSATPWYQFIVERRSDGAMIGDLGVGFGLPGERQVELGYRIHPEAQGRGYAREAVAALISYLVENHSIHRFVGIAASGNERSKRLLTTLGFRHEGNFRRSFLCHGEWLDDDYFALLAEEWRAGETARGDREPAREGRS